MSNPGVKDLSQKEYIGKILSDNDSQKLQGRYKVHIPELMYQMSNNSGIWCKNAVHANRVTNSESGTYGSYVPLHPGTNVIVKFVNNDPNTGYITRIVSDDKSNSLPFNITDRDDYYQIMRTPKNNNIIGICENTSDLPNNSIHIYYHHSQTVIIIDQEGYHFHTNNNKDVTIKENYQSFIEGFRRTELLGENHEIYHNNVFQKILGNCDQTTNGNKKIHIKGNLDIKVDGNITITSGNNIDIDSLGGIITTQANTKIIDRAPSIQHQGGSASNKALLPTEPTPTEIPVMTPNNTPSNKTTTSKLITELDK